MPPTLHMGSFFRTRTASAHLHTCMRTALAAFQNRLSSRHSHRTCDSSNTSKNTSYQVAALQLAEQSVHCNIPYTTMHVLDAFVTLTMQHCTETYQLRFQTTYSHHHTGKIYACVSCIGRTRGIDGTSASAVSGGDNSLLGVKHTL